MDIMDILGGLMQAKAAPSASRRIQNVFGASEEDMQSSGGSEGFGIEDLLGGLLGAGKTSGTAGGGMLEQILNQVGDAVGGKKNLAVGGLSALLGSILGGGKSAATGALGGGLMALLAAMAMNALQNSGKSTGKVPVGLLAPETEEQQRDLQSGAELVVAAMINAAKSDGRIDKEEYGNITGKLQKAGVSKDDMYYIIEELQKPMNTESIIRAGRKSPELAAQIYAATLKTIEVDTQAERAYVRELASGMGLTRDVVRNIEQMVGMQQV